jgi:transcription elongation factor Elf1
MSDVCPRCGSSDVVVVRATKTGQPYAACRDCDAELEL